MFPRVLLVGEQHRSLELDWWGFGGLQVRDEAGLVNRANALQTEFFRSAEVHLNALVQQRPTTELALDELYRSVMELLDHPPFSMQWKGALYEGPEEFAKLAVETSGFRMAPTASQAREVLQFESTRVLS